MIGKLSNFCAFSIFASNETACRNSKSVSSNKNLGWWALNFAFSTFLLSISWVPKFPSLPEHQGVLLVPEATGVDNLRLFFSVLCLNSGPTLWVTPPALFCERFFWDRILWTICIGWLQTVILLISVSQIARIIGVSHQCPAKAFFMIVCHNFDT
jgi:hypothetical protein